MPRKDGNNKRDAYIKKHMTKRTGVWVSIVGVIIAVCVLDMTTFVGGNIRFYSAWIQCGQRPLTENMLLGGNVPYYDQAPIIGIFRGTHTRYYCTPVEAERAGLSADPHKYSFPHLDQQK